MRILLILSVLLLTGCHTIPVQYEFPNAPTELMSPVKKLKQTDVNSSPSQIFDIVIENYSAYHELSNRLENWQKWYVEQKSIYEKNKKWQSNQK